MYVAMLMRLETLRLEPCLRSSTTSVRSRCGYSDCNLWTTAIAGSEALKYRLRETGGQWKILDVYYRDNISQLTTRRSEFASALANGGAPALIARLNQLAASSR